MSNIKQFPNLPEDVKRSIIENNRYVDFCSFCGSAYESHNSRAQKLCPTCENKNVKRYFGKRQMTPEERERIIRG